MSKIRKENERPSSKKVVYKRNELVRGNIGKMSIYAAKLLNAIYFLVQKNKSYTSEWQSTSFSELRDLMRLENTNTYNDTIKDALTELAQPIPLNRYQDSKGVEHSYYLLKFLDDARVKKDTENIVDFKIYPEMLSIMQIPLPDGNFTALEFYKRVNTFSSKYTMKLYEYLVSYEKLKSITITQQQLADIFNYQKSFSEILRIVDRCEKEMKKHDILTSIKRNVDTKAKTLTYYFQDATRVSFDAGQETLKQFVARVKKDFKGRVFVKPYFLGLIEYKKYTLLKIDEKTELVANNSSGVIIDAKEAEQIFTALYEEQKQLGLTEIEPEDFIDEIINIEMPTKNALGGDEKIDRYYKIIEVRKNQNGTYNIELKDELTGTIGWSSKEYTNKEELLTAINSRLG